MKKKLALLIGISLACGAATFTFAQDVPNKDGTKTTKKNKKKKSSKTTSHDR